MNHVIKISKESMQKSMKTISGDRNRTNLLRKWEQQAIAFLVQIIPRWLSSNALTFIGFLGNVLIFVAFVLAANLDVVYLLFGVLGFAISWFGDSLDGRVAYYRHLERKNYGFALDITVDWLGIIMIGLGFMIYIPAPFQLIGFGFVVFYGWEMLTTLLRYRITGKYSIDSGLLGPTEVRIIISLILILEVIVKGSILYVSIIVTSLLFINNIIDTAKLLKYSDEVDAQDKEEKK
jgi:hypothetical protein